MYDGVKILAFYVELVKKPSILALLILRIDYRFRKTLICVITFFSITELFPACISELARVVPLAE